MTNQTNDFHIPDELSGAEIDTLIALVERGPLDDGDLPSKQGCAHLMMRNYCTRISVKGEQGFSAATYMGCEAYANHFGCSTIKEAMVKRQEMKSKTEDIRSGMLAGDAMAGGF